MTFIPFQSLLHHLHLICWVKAEMHSRSWRKSRCGCHCTKANPRTDQPFVGWMRRLAVIESKSMPAACGCHHVGVLWPRICANYTSVDPKQFTVSKFRLKPVILISECFCSRCGHTNQHPPPTWRETTGDNGRQDHFRAQEGGHTNHPPPPTWRETTGDNGRQRETRPLQSPRSRPHQPTPRRPDLKLH